MTDETTHLDVIAVGAHPDDIEIACGGTLAKLSKQGYRCGIIDLTNGEPTPRCDDPSIRLAEADAAAKMLGVAVRRVLDFPNRQLFDGFDVRVALAKEFRRFKPKIVIGFGCKTPLASPDHYQAMLITDAAVFYSRLSKWETHFGDLAPHTISTQLYFHLGFENTHTSEFGSIITVDVSDEIETKLAAIRCYQTQFPPEKQRTFDRVRAVAMTTGLGAGFTYGESFATVRAIGCQDLVKAVLPK